MRGNAELTKTVANFTKDAFKNMNLDKEEILITNNFWHLVVKDCDYDNFLSLVSLCNEKIITSQSISGDNCLHYLVLNKKISLVIFYFKSRQENLV